MIFGAFVTLAALGSLPPHHSEVRRHYGRSAIAIRPPAVNPNELYSLRARRRFASYLRLRLLELREANLQRAADAIERHLPISELLGSEPAVPGCAKRGIPQP